MISRTEALSITAENFPNGPENLAAGLTIPIVRTRLTGVEGWCVRGANTIIRINSNSSGYRQRFTLAHELAHLVLGTEPDIASEPFSSDIEEEREADQLASEFLIPKIELDRYLRGQLPVDAKTLERLAKAANVSPVVAACRVVGATHDLGLQNAAVVFFVQGTELWRYSQSLKFNKDNAAELLRMTIQNGQTPARVPNRDGNIVVGSLIDAQLYQVLLIQLLPKETASNEIREERLRTLASQLFESDYSLRQAVAAYLGTVKGRCQGQSLDEAVHYFQERYLTGESVAPRLRILISEEGAEYIRLNLEKWFS